VLGIEDEEALVLDLLESGVLVHPGYFYGYESGGSCDARIMLSCLTEPTRLALGIERLIDAVDAM
jgi:hypothetical protein